MGVIHLLSSFALRQAAGEGAGGLLQALGDHAGDGSQRLLTAIRRANERAWKALEVAGAGEWRGTRLDRAEDRAFRGQVRSFLDALPLPELFGKSEFRAACLNDLRQARRRGLLLGPIVAGELTAQAGAFTRFTDPAAPLEAEPPALAGPGGAGEGGAHAPRPGAVRHPAQAGESLAQRRAAH